MRNSMSSAKDIFVEIPAGSAVFKEGDPAGEMYIVEAGQVDLVVESAGGGIVASLGPGDFFGEAALLDGQAHAVSALASTTSRLLRIERAAFADVARQNADIAVRILKQIVARQRHAATRKPAAEERPKAKPAAPAPAPPPAPAPKAVEASAPPPPPAAPPPPAPAPPAAAVGLALKVAGSDQLIALDASRDEFLVGRPDPASGIEPEVNLGPFDGNRTLSRRHAKILREGSLYFVREENGVANGTHVNGERLQSGVKTPIKAGDKLRFGLIEVELLGV
jgi:hypothetical protein